MSRYILVLVSGILIAISSCKSNEGNKELNSLQQEREKLINQANDINKKITEINSKIDKINHVDNTIVVNSYKVEEQPFEHTIDIQSNVTTDLDVNIFPEFAGIIKWSVKEGQRVSKGQTLARINDGGLSQQLKQAEIQASMAQIAYEKQERLWNQNIGSEMQYLQAKTASQSASKQIDALKSQLGRTSIKAPFSGTIDQLLMQNGQVVSPGVPVAKLINLNNMMVVADVSEKYLTKVKSGSLVKIIIGDLNKTIMSKVSRVSNFINPNNRSFSVEIPIQNSNNELKPNMSAKIQIVDYHSNNSLLVPTSTVLLNAENNKYVYVLTNLNGNNAIVKKALVTTGESNTNFVEIRSGIKPGDLVVNEGNDNISDGMKVKISQ